MDHISNILKKSENHTLDVLNLYKVFGYRKIRGNSYKIVLYNIDERKPLVLENDANIVLPNDKEVFYIDAIIKNYAS